MHGTDDARAGAKFTEPHLIGPRVRTLKASSCSRHMTICTSLAANPRSARAVGDKKIFYTKQLEAVTDLT
jgi:hypothetical protein